MKSPNWLYGQRKPDDQTLPRPDDKQSANAGVAKTDQEFGGLDGLSSLNPYAEEELFNR